METTFVHALPMTFWLAPLFFLNHHHYHHSRHYLHHNHHDKFLEQHNILHWLSWCTSRRVVVTWRYTKFTLGPHSHSSSHRQRSCGHGRSCHANVGTNFQCISNDTTSATCATLPDPGRSSFPVGRYRGTMGNRLEPALGRLDAFELRTKNRMMQRSLRERALDDCYEIWIGPPPLYLFFLHKILM